MLFVSYQYIATYCDGAAYKDFGNIFLEDTKEPKCEEEMYEIEAEIREDVKRRVGFERSIVTILFFKEV
jgi:hypothetical protein